MKDKYIHSMPEKDVQNYLVAVLSEKDTGGIVQFVRDNSLLVFAISAIIILLVVLVVTQTVSSRRNAMRNQELRRASEAKSEFLSRKSHDMRTPLNAVMGFAHLAEDEPETSPAVKDI